MTVIDFLKNKNIEILALSSIHLRPDILWGFALLLPTAIISVSIYFVSQKRKIDMKNR
jgi:hypothetical protein